MIGIRRGRVRTPVVLSASEGPAARERSRAALHFQKVSEKPIQTDADRPKSRKSRPRKSFDFKVYKNEAVKARLQELFNGKCAYCESYYAGVHPVDVEHWRPKAEIEPEEWEGSDPLTGYWFLASDWDNLLPSCIDCNRARSQKDLGGVGTRLMGKANLFPIERDSSRARCKDDLAGERPLLLNPCEDNPTDHIECDASDPSILRPYADSVKGQRSIDVYGLNRAGLVVARRERLAKIRLHLYELKTLCDLARRTQSVLEKSIIEDLMGYEMRALAAFRKEDEPFTMMSRAVIDAFMKETFKPSEIEQTEGPIA